MMARSYETDVVSGSTTEITNELTGILGDLRVRPVKFVRNIRVSLKAVDQPPKARAFRDLHSEVIGLHIVPHLPFASSIEGSGIRFEVDAHGELVYLELDCEIPVITEIPPIPAGHLHNASIRFLDRPARFDQWQVTECRMAADNGNQPNSLIHITLGEKSNDRPSNQGRYFRPADNLIVRIGKGSILEELWILDVETDIEMRLCRQWRTNQWQRIRHQRAAEGLRSPCLPVSFDKKILALRGLNSRLTSISSTGVSFARHASKKL